MSVNYPSGRVEQSFRRMEARLNPAQLRAIFLSNDTVYMRAYVEDDKHAAQAWAGTRFPVGSPRGEQLLKDWHREWGARTRRYALCRSATDEVVGGVTVGVRHLVGEFIVAMAPWLDDADELRAAAFELIVPWLSEEWSLVSVTGHIEADQPATIEAAERLGMQLAATMREFYTRPGGMRVDDLFYQKLRSIEATADA
jgi:RimJ/RimL family protein N-acetyltransferase